MSCSTIALYLLNWCFVYAKAPFTCGQTFVKEANFLWVSGTVAPTESNITACECEQGREICCCTLVLGDQGSKQMALKQQV